MTNFSISAKWYPVGAITILLFVLLWFVFRYQFPKWHVRCLVKGSTKREATPATGEATPNAVKAAKFPNDNRPSISNAAAGNTITAQPSQRTSDPAANRKLNFLHRLNPYSRRIAGYEVQSIRQSIPPAPETSYSAKIPVPREPCVLSVGPSVLPAIPSPISVTELPLGGIAFEPSLQVPYGTTVLPSVYSLEGESSSTIPLVQMPTPLASWPLTSESQGGFDP